MQGDQLHVNYWTRYVTVKQTKNPIGQDIGQSRTNKQKIIHQTYPNGPEPAT
jgi:hypothetical protein